MLKEEQNGTNTFDPIYHFLNGEMIIVLHKKTIKIVVLHFLPSFVLRKKTVDISIDLNILTTAF